MFIWLAVALFIDGVDGTLARRFRVAEMLPRWSGDTNFLPVVGRTKALPQLLDQTWEVVHRAWNELA